MAAKKSSSGKQKAVAWLTPWMTARYPKIGKPDTDGKYADGKFKTDGFLDDDDYAAAEKHLRDVASKFWPDVDANELQIPVKVFYANAEAQKKDEPEGQGLRLKSKYRPAVFDSKKSKLPDGVSIGSGSIIRVASFIFPYKSTEKVKVNGKIVQETVYGVGLRLGDVQVKELVEYQGGGDGSAFDEVEDGFEYETDDRADQFSEDDADAL